MIWSHPRSDRVDGIIEFVRVRRFFNVLYFDLYYLDLGTYLFRMLILLCSSVE